MIEPLVFNFPLPRVHTGVHLANGRMGVLVWGERELILTFARNGFWDRRAVREDASPLTYEQIRDLLIAGRESEIRPAFEREEGSIRQIGGGRLVLDFGEPPVSATLSVASGVLRVRLAGGGEVEILQDMVEDRLRLLFHDCPSPTVTLEPAWRRCGEALAALGFRPPTEWHRGRVRNFVQATPSDETLFAGIVEVEGELDLTVSLQFSQDWVDRRPDTDTFRQRCEDDWSAYWERIPDDLAADPNLRYSLWKLHAVHHPQGCPATLQGPWMEDHRLPLWSNDYHFNINLQMMVLPCLELELYDHLMPLWRMLAGWMPRLRSFGERFYGRPGAVFLPHATDDRANPIGAYWQGTIDPVSTAWMGQLAWRAAKGSGNTFVLHEVALPLLRGGFEAFYAMLEPDGEALRLPIGISPEFGEGACGFWGPNPSFALAALHRLCLDLAEASETHNPRWEEVRRRLPAATLVQGPEGRDRIGLWENQDLTESHRHHSHLAGLEPFRTLTTPDAPWVIASLEHWSRLGGGGWSAWGTVWAIQILSAAGWVSGAKAWYRFLLASALNEGDSLSAGGARGTFISWGSADVARQVASEGDHEVMQLDANLGLISAWLAIQRAENNAEFPPQSGGNSVSP